MVVPDRHAFHEARLQAARERCVGRQIVTIEGLVARLAGPFLRPPDTGSVRAAVVRARRADLGDMAGISRLPGFVRAASATLERAWERGIDARRPPTAHRRWRGIAALEAAVLAHLPADVRLPRDLAALAVGRAALAPAILGPVRLYHVDEVALCWRPVIAALAEHVPLTWHRFDHEHPAWLPPGVAVVAEAPAEPTLERIACATPAHEVLEALRWARALIAQGRAAPHDIAIAAASPGPYDALVLAAAGAAGLPVHAVHGVSLCETAAGVRVAALADVLARGPTLERVRRAAESLAPTHGPDAAPLQDDAWWRDLPADVPLTTPARWRRALRGRPSGAHGTTPTDAWLMTLVEALAAGPDDARPIGEAYLEGDALAAWRRALDDGPAHAIDATVARLRTADGIDPTAAIAWGPAEVLSLSPRPHARLLGLSARSWPRRNHDDPLLGEHVLGVALAGAGRAEGDRRAYERVLRFTTASIVLSRARRDGDGRELVASPLLTAGPAAGVSERALLDRLPPAHALDEADRLAARPEEFARHPLGRSTVRAWRAWRSDDLTPHDGLLSAGHPAIVRALGRVHSATSLRRLVRDPQGFVWRYALGWEELEQAEEPFMLDPRTLGTFIHEVLERTVRDLEATQPGAFAAADDDALVGALERSLALAADATAERTAVPPPVAWRRIRADVRELALAALRHPFEALPNGRTYAEAAFGVSRPQRPDVPPEQAPWDPGETVAIGSAGLRIGGYIDRLDVAGDRSRARVVDYKTGRVPRVAAARGLQGGRELQRCLYALAARHFFGPEVALEAVLVFPRETRAFALDDPDAALARLLDAIDAAHAALQGGKALPGPDAFDVYNDLRFALPADAGRRYRTIKEPRVRTALPALHTLWSEA